MSKCGRRFFLTISKKNTRGKNKSNEHFTKAQVVCNHCESIKNWEKERTKRASTLTRLSFLVNFMSILLWESHFTVEAIERILQKFVKQENGKSFDYGPDLVRKNLKIMEQLVFAIKIPKQRNKTTSQFQTWNRDSERWPKIKWCQWFYWKCTLSALLTKQTALTLVTPCLCFAFPLYSLFFYFVSALCAAFAASSRF